MKDLIQRGIKKPTPLTKAFYIFLRTLDLALQYHLLTSFATATYLSTTLGLPLHPYHTLTVYHGLLFQTPHLPLLLMATGTWAKQVYGSLFLTQESLTLPSALFIAFYNSLINTTNTLLFICAPTTSLSSPERVDIGPMQIPTTTVIGSCLYICGLAIELASEVQRRSFKTRKGNEDKVMRSGLWWLARHVNYGAHSTWRAGYTLAASGWTAGAVMFAVQTWDFVARAVPQIEEYCGKRYGAQWVLYRNEVRWVMFPWIY